MILDLVDLDKHLVGACAAITGEGSLDHQPAGKAVGVSRHAGALGIPTYAVAGTTPADARSAGFDDVHTLSDLEPDRQRSIERAADLSRSPPSA
jgi:glycerate kinase